MSALDLPRSAMLLPVLHWCLSRYSPKLPVKIREVGEARVPADHNHGVIAITQ